MKFNKSTIYIGLFSILYLIVAFSSFYHACAFFGLANNSWMSVILAFAFEIGQVAVLFSLLTSKKDRSRIMPWVLMTMFTLVQVIGNVFSSYKYIITNSVENLRYFKEPIFIWTDLPDQEATVIVTWAIGAILPIAALLITSMITNYLSDQEEEIPKEESEVDKDEKIKELEEKLERRVENLRVAENTANEEVKKLTNARDNLIEENKALKEKLKDIPTKEKEEKIKEKLEDIEEKPTEINNEKKEKEIDESTLEQANQMMQGNVEKIPEVKNSHFINI